MKSKLVALGLCVAFLVSLAAPFAPAQVTSEKLLKAADDGTTWLTYGRDYRSTRFSPLDQVNDKNVKKLVPKWTFQTGVLDGFETTPLVVDGIMYITTPWNHAFAIDAKTGAEIWRYDRQLPDNLALCCDAVNRGFGMLGDKLYLTTLDAHLVCLDSKTGNVVWDKEIGDYKAAYSATVAPLIVKDKVIVGISGAEYGIRGYIDAYDAKTGDLKWRFYTIPAKGEKGSETWEGDSWMNGGGSAWVTGSYDPELNQLYWGTGNPGPDFNGDVRKGANLYTVSMLSLDPDTGKLNWHYQASPNDIWDYDGVNEPILIDEEIGGKKVKALVQAHRNGYFYALDRTNGKFLYAKPFCQITWGKVNPDGTVTVDPKAKPTPEGALAYPGAAGGKEWVPMAYSPKTKMCYIPVIENGAKFTSGKVFYKKGLPYWGSSLTLVEGKAWGALRALDVRNGEQKWEFKTKSPMVAGVLATAGNLVFTGDAEGNFIAFDAEKGKVLWRFQTGSGIHAPPITYSIEGKQYVAIASGWGGWTAGFAGDGAPWLKNARKGDTLYVFGLFGDDEKKMAAAE